MCLHWQEFLISLCCDVLWLISLALDLLLVRHQRANLKLELLKELHIHTQTRMFQWKPSLFLLVGVVYCVHFLSSSACSLPGEGASWNRRWVLIRRTVGFSGEVWAGRGRFVEDDKTIESQNSLKDVKWTLMHQPAHTQSLLSHSQRWYWPEL